MDICASLYDGSVWPLLAIPTLKELTVNGAFEGFTPSSLESPMLENALQQRMRDGHPPLDTIRLGLRLERTEADRTPFFITVANGLRCVGELIETWSPATKFELSAGMPVYDAILYCLEQVGIYFVP